MILKGSQRGTGSALARHLLNAQDNEHIAVHDIRGFLADTLAEAFQEAHAQSRGTRCTQYLFSLSLSPPADQYASVQAFERAIARVEEKLGLTDQPRVIVFHEKEGRRHAHAVWSRIDTETMTAINLPFFKNRLMEVSKELYLEHGWKLPQGFIDRQHHNPLNFTLHEWQQAKRLEDDPQAIKQTLKTCWAVSDSRKALDTAMEQHGFTLARGDRRGYVAVDWRGEVYSLSRWLDVKTKDLRARLGEPAQLPSVEDTRAKLDQHLAQRVRAFVAEIDQAHAPRLAPLHARQSAMADRHAEERRELTERHEKREQQESQERQARFRTGLRGFWDRFTGKHADIRKQNEGEAYRAFARDREEKDALIYGQLEERRSLQAELETLRAERHNDVAALKEALFSRLPEEKIEQLRPTLEQQPAIQPERGFDLEM